MGSQAAISSISAIKLVRCPYPRSACFPAFEAATAPANSQTRLPGNGVRVIPAFTAGTGTVPLLIPVTQLFIGCAKTGIPSGTNVTGSNRKMWLMAVSDRESVHISLTEQGKNVVSARKCIAYRGEK